MSAVNSIYNHIFIHVPKNAGSSMERKAYVGGHGHDTLYEITKKFKDTIDFKNYIPWGFVRNPYDRLVSLYHFWRENEVPMANLPFDNFIKDYIRNHTTINILTYLENKEHFNVGVQPQFLFFDNDVYSPDEVFFGKVESIDSDYKEILGKIENKSKRKIKDKTLNKVNTSKRSHYRSYYNNETFDLVYEIYKFDVKHFGYEREQL